jgi:ureidoglycolate hydrolase
MDESLLEIRDYTGDGYRPLVDYGAWRVALLRFADDMLPQNIHRFQRHDETDEVFVLLEGRCILYIGEGDETITAIHAREMAPLKVYNVKRGVWHNHTLSQEAVVLIVENQDTGDHNSPFCPLKETQRQRLIELHTALWEGQPIE